MYKQQRGKRDKAAAVVDRIQRPTDNACTKKEDGLMKVQE